MTWKAVSTVFAGEAMQTPTVPSPSPAARIRNTNISAHSKGNGNPKTLEVQTCPKRRNLQSIELSPALFLCRGQQSGSRHLICHTQHIFPISLNNRKVPGFLTTRVIQQQSTTISPLQDSTTSASSLVSAMLILERIVSTNSPTEFIEARIEGNAISSALLHPRPPKFSGNPVCLHTFPSNDTLATLPRERKRALSKMRNSSIYK